MPQPNSNVASRLALSVVIPAYNEEERIGPTLLSIDRYLKEQPYAYEIIVVDDGSSDSTVRVVQELSTQVRQLKLLQQRGNEGKACAGRAGMLSALGRYRLFMDADGSTDIAHWDALRSELDAGSDVVVGSRHVAGSRIDVHQSQFRELLGGVFRHLVRMTFGLPIHDTQNGFKAFTSEAALRIFTRQKVTGWAFDVDVLSIAQRLGYSMLEVPVTWIDDDRSRMTMRAMPRMLMDLMRIRLNAVPTPTYRAIPQLRPLFAE